MRSNLLNSPWPLRAVADRGRVRALRLLFDRQNVARKSASVFLRLAAGGTIVQRAIDPRQRGGDQEPRVARDVDAVVDRHDHVDREIFGASGSDRRLPTMTPLSYTSAPLCRPAADLKWTAVWYRPRADVRDDQKDREKRHQAQERKEPDDRLFVHIGIGPTSLPCKNCWTIGLGEAVISSTCAVGDDRTFEQHGHVVGHLEDALQIVRDDDRGSVEPLAQADDQDRSTRA